MRNKIFDKLIDELKKKKLDAYIFKLSNENLYEFVSKKENPLIELTGFTGDTGEFLITRTKAYLLVDGRFIIQAKKEKNDSRIRVVKLDIDYNAYDFYTEVFKKGFKVGINPKFISVASMKKLDKVISETSSKLICDDKFFSKEISEMKKNYFYMSKAPLFLLDSRYVTKSTKEKIAEAIENGTYYVTCSLEEIAYITNIRYRFANIDNHGPLFKSFMIVNTKTSYLYISDYLEDDAASYLKKNHIVVKDIKDFYKDILNLRKKKNVQVDPSIISQYIYNKAKISEENAVESPFIDYMSIKCVTEIKNIRKCNILDGVAMTKALFMLKKHNECKNEYEVVRLVDKQRESVGKKLFLCNSFETIVAYKGNAAMCHYMPKKGNSKRLSSDGLLLIDSGGHYLLGTTDITRTISLYKNKKEIPSIIKKHYTMILNSMLKLAMQKFPYGLTGTELDIVARGAFYNEYIDYDHGTGHGIGYISNVHEGPNRIAPGIRKHYTQNIFEAGQVVSDEPGLYFENKYGIRIENDLLCVEEKSNTYADFLGFEILTLCPFDKDLIDKKYLEASVIPYLKAYNEVVYKKLSKYLDSKERAWLKEQTCL